MSQGMEVGKSNIWADEGVHRGRRGGMGGHAQRGPDCGAETWTSPRPRGEPGKSAEGGGAWRLNAQKVSFARRMAKM